MHSGIAYFCIFEKIYTSGCKDAFSWPLGTGFFYYLVTLEPTQNKFDPNININVRCQIQLLMSG